MSRVADLHTTTLGKSGPWVVFCHGLFGQGKNWTTAAKTLAGTHRVLLVDMPNHGRSAWTEHLDYVAMADEVAGLLDPAEPVALVGHSMGGKAAMLLTLRHPELVERLCVVDMSPVSYAEGGREEFGRYIRAMRALDLDALERRSQADEALVEAVPSPTVRGFLLQNLRRDSADGAASWRWQPNLELLGDELDVLGDWPADRLDGVAPYDGPVLWVAGAESPYVQPEHAEVMERWFPRVRKVTVKNAGHWVHSQQPEVFAEVLRRFVDAPA
ncbi:alpha/beta fold hydrolase [Nocardioides sp. CFH 31398]|uniref:alpha/beta fold hydrolase n=1 Tax=Nocardioides sp. CFH 31398 TaxID=2919579 RepID=UPI001F0650CD|nr:alpha/beta fold hydrolase [Nocardioides sp. CFH 31398]MCH1868847.1 alpha/beta fold hydrolase [Nocardioides sp. CFH 31398]